MVVIDKLEAIRQSAALEQPLPEPPEPQLSVLRVLALLVIIAASGVGIWQLVSARSSAALAKSPVHAAFAPYVDVTLTPTYQFQLPASDPVANAYLGFIVSRPQAPCQPSWGGYYSLAGADQNLDLQARVAQLRSSGGDPMVSFGGRDNSELAVSCTSAAKLSAAYLAVIQHYGSSVVDFDIEGAALVNLPAARRRAVALVQVAHRLARSHRALRVWLTLPVSTHGLTPQGLAQVRTMLSDHVPLAGVNVMAMDFGPGSGAARNMFGAVSAAIASSHRQVEALWHDAGRSGAAGAAWAHLGVTVMLGVNDYTAERFTIADARRLVKLANHDGIARVSAWSLNRDSECGSAFPVTGTLSNTCSGVIQNGLQFTRIFSGLRGTRTARLVRQISTAPREITDNPATSPYPIWNSSSAYVTGYKVVWQGDIYQAQWWSQGTAPNVASAVGTAPAPWLLIGPVPSHSTGFQPELLASTNQPQWRAGVAYHQGQRVEFKGLPYQARWYSLGTQPVDLLPGDPNSPWTPLFSAPGEPNDTGIGSGAGR